MQTPRHTRRSLQGLWRAWPAAARPATQPAAPQRQRTLTSAPMTPRDVRRRYSKGRVLEMVLRKGYRNSGMCAAREGRAVRNASGCGQLTRHHAALLARSTAAWLRIRAGSLAPHRKQVSIQPCPTAALAAPTTCRHCPPPAHPAETASASRGARPRTAAAPARCTRGWMRAP